MATDKVFTIVGTSSLNGDTKVRFANDIMRVKVLAKHGHENVNLIELDTPMDKLSAVQFIQGLTDVFSTPDEQVAISEYLEKNAPKTPKVKAEKPAKVAKVKKEKVEAAAKAAAGTLDEADEVAAAEKVVDEMDDQPF